MTTNRARSPRCVAGLCVAAWALAAFPVRAAPPVVALLDPGKNDVAALLEAKLLADPALTLVERKAVAAVLKEQEVSAAFGPQGVAARVKLGAVLKADVLVQVRPVAGAKQPAVEAAVSETAGGLRLATATVPRTKDATADAAALLAAVRAGLAKFGERVTEVVAIPPFVSHDLSPEHDHLKAAFATLAERAAMARPGVVAVELAEAEAVAAELALAAPGTAVRRPPPLYLIGEYRHDGTGVKRTLTLTLRAARSGKPVGETVSRAVPPAAAAVTVREWAAGRVGGAGPGSQGPVAPAAEAEQLLRLARTRTQLGSWSEAVALAEAGLLLAPDNLDLRREVLHVAATLNHMPPPPVDTSRPPADRVREAVRVQRRWLAHVDAYLRGGGKLIPRKGVESPIYYNVSGVNDFKYKVPDNAVPGELAELVRDVRREQLDMYRRLLPVCAGRPLEDVYALVYGLCEQPPAEKCKELETVLVSLQDRPDIENWAHSFALHGVDHQNPTQRAETLRFYDRLEAAGNARVKAGVAKARAMLVQQDKQTELNAAREKARKEEAAKRAAAGPRPDTFDAFVARCVGTPLKPTLLRSDRPEWVNPFAGIAAAGPGADVLWEGGTLWLMTERDKPKRVWTSGGSFPGLSGVAYDGRFVWAATVRVDPSAVVVLDPTTGKAVEIAQTAGLPKPAPGADSVRLGSDLIVAPFAPGKAVVAGSVGRAWVAVVTFDPAKGRATAKVIHEAREAQNGGDHEQWKRTTVAFNPCGAHAVHAPPGPDGKPVCRVIVGRGPPAPGFGSENNAVNYHPLVVDPFTEAVSVFPHTTHGPFSPRWFGPGDGCVYIGINNHQLARYRGPAFAREPLPGKFPGFISDMAYREHAGRLYAAERVETGKGSGFRGEWDYGCDYRWWTADADGKNLRKAADGLTAGHQFFVSTHYGLCVLAGGRGWAAVCAVDLPAGGGK